MGGIPKDPIVRHLRAKKAAEASVRAKRQQALERAAGLTPAEAYTRGYQMGYRRAYVYWHRWAWRAIQKAS